ncbi:hypothetical protein K458DRAFT_57777 [Lentithecium fluviatile CBS 122367]|uniref:Uncharacterized protein n=1 Tax=Lentithecium fluviatile CBS 122367 TaxID=1168545 RepID=A0A6G1IWR3_9PLEO|nr:hypothetical protein K458DRAFT_57777 [Lentithecium fluviatile CBS 122367]
MSSDRGLGFSLLWPSGRPWIVFGIGARDSTKHLPTYLIWFIIVPRPRYEMGAAWLFDIGSRSMDGRSSVRWGSAGSRSGSSFRRCIVDIILSSKSRSVTPRRTKY